MGRPRKSRSPAEPAATAGSSDGDSGTEGYGSAGSSTCTAVAKVLTRPKRVQRTRSGCVTCKQRRKKCDEKFIAERKGTQPRCGDCRRLGLVCQRSPAPSSRRPTTSPSIFTTLIAPPPPICFYDGCTPQEKHLLQHYTCVVSKSLSVVPDEINSFISLFVPMALQQPAMRNALLGLSATHLKRVHPGYDLAAVEHQNKAVHMANALLRKGDDQSSMEGLAAILFLCLQEICEGRSRQWPMHLEAAVTLINNKGGPMAFPYSVRFLVEAVAYFDSVATLSLTKSAFLDQQFYLPLSPVAPLPAHALFGTSHALFAIIADISQLSQVSHIRYHSPAAETNFRAVASELELQLQTWSPVPCTSQTTDPNLHYKVTAAGIMLQWAALMRLHLIVESSDPRGIHHPKVRTAVRNILVALEAIPEGDLVESMLVFPMFAAGFGAVTEEEKRTVRERFAIMERSIGFGNVFDAHELVELKWRKVEEERRCGLEVVGSAENMTWEQLVREGEQTLLMG
ncbi:hypothetical protein EX30DRAFT_375195, partial [Ascodesmis nigricans]